MQFFHLLTPRNRTRHTNRQLGGLLAFVAGAINAGDRDKLQIHATILALFFFGALIDASSFKWTGFLSTLPFAAVLTLVAMPPLLQDLQAYLHSSKGVLQ